MTVISGGHVPIAVIMDRQVGPYRGLHPDARLSMPAADESLVGREQVIARCSASTRSRGVSCGSSA